jgi:hypothetical protein
MTYKFMFFQFDFPTKPKPVKNQSKNRYKDTKNFIGFCQNFGSRPSQIYFRARQIGREAEVQKNGIIAARKV